jgi:hypothetical protein
MTEEELKEINKLIDKSWSIKHIFNGGHAYGIEVGGENIPYNVVRGGLIRYYNQIAKGLRDLGYEGKEAEGIDEEPETNDNESLVHVPGAKFPLAWDRAYYAVELSRERENVHCFVCNGIGKVAIDRTDGRGKYVCTCPVCHGSKEVAVTKSETWGVSEYRLYLVRIEKGNGHHYIEFDGVRCGKIVMEANEKMAYTRSCFDSDQYIYQTGEEAKAEADRLNAEMEAKSV